jgi:hypothetical protein
MRSRTPLVGGFVFMALRCGGEDEPDLTNYGIGLPPGGAGTWSVGSDLGATTTDEWIELTLDHDAFLNEHGRVGWAFSIERTFTLAN